MKHSKLLRRRRCKVCGAKVNNISWRVQTCDGICTRAAKRARTRQAQIIIEINAMGWPPKLPWPTPLDP